MKQGILLLLMLILTISYVGAIDVHLQYPENGAPLDNYQTTFRCVTSIENADTITLRLKPQGDMWYPIQTKNAIEFIPVEFDYTFLTSGNYIWNCLAKNSTGGEFLAPTDFSLQVDINSPPTINPTISNQEKDISSGSWVLDLSGNANDNEDIIEDLRWSISGVDTSICNVEIISGDIASFTPISAGSDTITFILMDTSNLTATQDTTVTITEQSSSNDPPSISGVPDQTKEIDDTWTLNLDEYIDDDEDSDSKLIISVSGEDTSIFTVSIDQDDNELTFTAEDEGTDDFTITVKDTDEATDSQTITVTINEEGTIDDDSSGSDDDLSIDITKASPATARTIILKPGEEKTFEITTNTYDIVWYLDNKKVEENSRSYTFEPTAEHIGEHIIKVIAGDELDKDMKTWDIKVEGNETISISTGACGNNKININETCLNCPEDVQCKQGEYCDEGTCKRKTLTKITGLFTSSKDFILDKWYYPTLILGIILLIIITIIIIRMNKKPKTTEDPLEQFSEKQTFWKRIQRKLRDWDRRRQLKKQNNENIKKLDKARKDHIRVTAPNVDSIKIFIKQRETEGYKKRQIIKALKRNGWSRKHIKIAFKQLKNDSPRPT